MSMATAHAPLTVRQIILAHHADLMKDIAGFLAIAAFVMALLIWAY